MIHRPDGNLVQEVLVAAGANRFELVSPGLCGPTGDYSLSIVAVGDSGVPSLPVSTTLTRAVDCAGTLIFASGFE